MPLHTKMTNLQNLLSEMKQVVIAFSGGVDSTFLLKVAADQLGTENVIALTATSPTYPDFEYQQACELAQEIGVEQIVIESNELEIPGFAENPPRRCYHCKYELFSLCLSQAKERGFSMVLDGSNLDDMGDYRPGRDAVKELEVRSPLLEAGLTKEDIRNLSRELGLKTWNKQAFACLSSRFPYGTRITLDRLQQIDSCETFLRENNFKNYRVRYHDQIARIEVAPEEIARLIDVELRDRLISSFKQAGFTYVTLDLQGYRTGSMNATLPETTKDHAGNENI